MKQKLKGGRRKGVGARRVSTLVAERLSTRQLYAARRIQRTYREYAERLKSTIKRIKGGNRSAISAFMVRPPRAVAA